MSCKVTSERVEVDSDYLQDFVRSLNLSNEPEASSVRLPDVDKTKVNPYSKVPYTSRYFKLLKERQKLPVYEYKEEFLSTLRKKQVVIVVGDTGSGKTTQIPQWCIEYVKGESGIACTQPRRVTATSVAKRVAEEMDFELGQQVGYSIRFESCTSMATILRYMTDGILLREAMKDRLLNEYGVILLDETHERALPTDVLMGLLKDAVRHRPELRLVVMSATLDYVKFQKYFQDAVILKIPGRTYPVEVHHSNKYEGNYVPAAVNKVIEIHRLEQQKGDILVFLTGQEEIEDTCSQIEYEATRLGTTYGPLTVLPLYSSLPTDQQQLVFEPLQRNDAFGIARKVVVATNVAETSLTIDGVAFVVDPGFVKEKVYNRKTRGESLQVTRISQASAKQRTGRAGRTCPGKCYRLYSERVFNEMLPFTPPVILNSNMGSVVLQLKRMGIKDVVNFDFMDKPEPDAMRQAIEQLFTLDALDEEEDVTELGELMSEFPLDPPVAKMLIASCDYNCTKEILTIAAMLSVQQCFLWNKKTKVAANTKKLQFSSMYGDHIMLMNVYDQFKQNFDSQRWCQTNYVNYRALKAADAARMQLAYIVENMALRRPGTKHSTQDANYTNVRKALVRGFFNQVAVKSGPYQYKTVAENQTVFLHPSTCLNTRIGPQCVVYHEQFTTNKDYIRVCTPIEREWVQEHAPRGFVVKTSVSVPYLGSGLGYLSMLQGSSLSDY